MRQQPTPTGPVGAEPITVTGVHRTSTPQPRPAAAGGPRREALRLRMVDYLPAGAEALAPEAHHPSPTTLITAYLRFVDGRGRQQNAPLLMSERDLADLADGRTDIALIAEAGPVLLPRDRQRSVTRTEFAGAINAEIETNRLARLDPAPW